MLKSRMSLSWQRRYVEQNDDKEKSHYFDVWSFWAVDNISPRMSLVLRISQTNIPIFPVFHAHRRTSSCEIHGKLAILALELTGKVTKMSFVLPSDVTVAARRFTQFQKFIFIHLFRWTFSIFYTSFPHKFSTIFQLSLRLSLIALFDVNFLGCWICISERWELLPWRWQIKFAEFLRQLQWLAHDAFLLVIVAKLKCEYKMLLEQIQHK